MAKPTTIHDYTCVITDIDRRKYGRRTVPVKVLMLGMVRTATAKALTALGINTYHGDRSVLENPRDFQMWHEAIQAKFEGIGTSFGRKDFDQLLGTYQGISDLPAILFAEELIEAYPDAKVILTTRDYETWYRSCSSTIQPLCAKSLMNIIMPLASLLHVHSCYVRPTLLKAWNILMDGNFEQNASRQFIEHYQHIRRLVPPNRLLEYDVRDGWDPLCKFLDVPRPDISFPRANSTYVMIQRHRVLSKLLLQSILKKMLFLVVLTSLPMLASYAVLSKLGS